MNYLEWQAAEKTEHGIPILELMVKFIEVFEGREPEKTFNELKYWIGLKLGRKLSVEEETSLTQGIVNYLQSDAETSNREKAMKFLFETKFLEPIQN